eukprot:9646930-Alexandrium_andersonii.AAC.1
MVLRRRHHATVGTLQCANPFASSSPLGQARVSLLGRRPAYQPRGSTFDSAPGRGDLLGQLSPEFRVLGQP